MTVKSPNKADILVYKALKTAINQDKLRLYLDYNRINKAGSPVYDPWETLLPILIPVLIGLGLIISVGVIIGLLCIGILVQVFSVYFKRKIYRRVVDRTKNYLISDYDNCEKLWRWGGIVLVNADNKKLGCVAPDGDWKDFVIINYADLMVEKKSENKESEGEEPTAAA